MLIREEAHHNERLSQELAVVMALANLVHAGSEQAPLHAAIADQIRLLALFLQIGQVRCLI